MSAPDTACAERLGRARFFELVLLSRHQRKLLGNTLRKVGEMTHSSEPGDRGLNIRRKAQAGIVGLGLLACAFILPVWQFREWNQSRQSDNWPHVTGTIMHSGPPLYDDETYDPNITYEFEVHGKRCTGSNVQFGIGAYLLSSSDAESWIAKYPAGSRVTVYYDPHTPCIHNVLERAYKPPDWSILIAWATVSLVAAFYGLKFLVKGLKRMGGSE